MNLVLGYKNVKKVGSKVSKMGFYVERTEEKRFPTRDYRVRSL